MAPNQALDQALDQAIVIGGGIGGLTAALALHRQGIPVTVHERAASLEPVGAGLALAPNALRALDRLGVGERLRALAAPHPAVGLRRPSGRDFVPLRLLGSLTGGPP